MLRILVVWRMTTCLGSSLRNGQNPPLETEIDLRGGARMFFGQLGSQPKMFAVLREVIQHSESFPPEMEIRPQF
mgnify:CR=1 FL=1